MDPLKIDQAEAYFDLETHIAYIAYRGVLHADVTVQVYDWLDAVYDEVGLENVHGQVFDFSAVEMFDPGNLKVARRTSSRANMKQDTSHIPVGLIVSTPIHEETLRTDMRILPENTRKKIVWSMEAALEFIETWHKEKSPQ